MPKIIKITTGDAGFILEEKFEDEAKAQEGTDPVSSEVKDIEVKVENIKWKKSNE